MGNISFPTVFHIDLQGTLLNTEQKAVRGWYLEKKWFFQARESKLLGGFQASLHPSRSQLWYSHIGTRVSHQTLFSEGLLATTDSLATLPFPTMALILQKVPLDPINKVVSMIQLQRFSFTSQLLDSPSVHLSIHPSVSSKLLPSALSPTHTLFLPSGTVFIPVGLIAFQVLAVKSLVFTPLPGAVRKRGHC